MSNSFCVFCKIVQGEIPATIVYETPTTLAFRDVNPKAPHHILVIPKRHMSSLIDLSGDHESLMGDLFSSARQVAVDQGLHITGFRTVVNTGRDAGQEVDHVHVHLLAGRPLKWPPG
jgi:histidine triad (HIT) family protein